MKPNTKIRLRDMSEEQAKIILEKQGQNTKSIKSCHEQVLTNRFKYLKSKQLPGKESNIMKYIKRLLKKRFGKVLDEI